MFYLGGVGLSLFLTLLLVTKQRRTNADRILAGWLLIITIHLLLYYFHKTNQYPQLLGLNISLPLVHGPFLYWYTRALTNSNISIFHFIPPVAVLLYTVPFLLLPAELKFYVYQNNGAGYETFNLINRVITMVSGVLYVSGSSFVLQKHRKSIVLEFSSTDKINLLWLQYLIYWLGFIWIFVIFRNDELVFGAVVLFIAFIGFFGVRQVGIFQPSEIVQSINKNKPSEIVNEDFDHITSQISDKRKYLKSGLTDIQAEVLHRRLIQTMETEKLFRESELSLNDLATRLSTQPNYLSQVINEREGKNFYDYINTLRIDEFKRIASSSDSRRFTLFALAQECGFNSKSSFNRYFKKVTGQSPSEFVQAVFEPQN